MMHRISTVEEFAQNAGLPEKIGRLHITEDSFLVITKSGVYSAEFYKNKTGIAYFSSEILGRALTREEASDVMDIIEYYMPEDQRELYTPILKRLHENLPQLGFSTATPLWSYTDKPSPQI